MPEPSFDRDLVVCRCEEVTLGDLLDARAAGFASAELLKRATRTMMGPCQGRMCRTAFARICSALVPRSPGAGRIRDSIASLPDRGGRAVPGTRPPVRPVSLGEIAALERFAPPPPRETKDDPDDGPPQ